ncbi:Fe-S cluster assembly protein SufD, partial [Staphylococcus chromogenes]|nr:Fe-S cluster assembly protein SufD [Staphylococcus chromogenes]
MTTETLNISEAQLVDYSKAHREPSWMTELRKDALKQAESLEMPKPDKTKIDKWDFDSFKQHETTGSVFESLHDLPKEIDRIINVEASENLIIQHNNTLAFSKVNLSLIHI